MGNLIEYDDYTVEDAEQDEAELKSGSNFIKLSEGRNVVRFVPAPKGKVSRVIYYQHFITARDGSRVSFACPRRTTHNGKKGRPCPACEHAEKLSTSPSAADQKAAKSYFARSRILAAVVDRARPEAGVQLLGMGKQIWDQLSSVRKDEDSGGNYMDPVNGFDICIERSGTGFDTEYKVRPARKNSRLAPTDDEINELILSVPDLAAHPTVQIQEPDAIRRLVNAEAEPEPRGALPKASAEDDEFIDVDGDDDFV